MTKLDRRSIRRTARGLARLLRRRVRRMQAQWSAEPNLPRPLVDRYLIKAGYVSRSVPVYDDERGSSDIIHQPDVYALAGAVAEDSGATVVVDLGCGGGEKLVELSRKLDVIGIDLGANILHCARRYGIGSWREHDLDSPGDLPVSDAELKAAIVVCSDVIEHLLHPEVLLGTLRRCLDGGAKAILLSTPERNLHRGVRHMGPPPNSSHVREWAIDELGALLAAHGFHTGFVTLTRSMDLINDRNTILAVLLG